MEMVTERIQETHFRIIGDFQCKIVECMESFLKSEAFICDGNGEGNTYIVFDNKRLIGYYTIKCNAIQIELGDVKKVYPAIEVSRFAIDDTYQRKGYGTMIFQFLLSEICELRNYVGIKCIILYAFKSSIGFYKKFGFDLFPDDVQVLPSWEIDKLSCKGMYAVLE